MPIRTDTLVIWLIATAALSPAAAQTPVGDPFTVNTTRTGHQGSAAVAAGSDGGFAVVWRSENQDGDGWGVFARWYDILAGPLTDEVQVNVFTTGNQLAPRVTADGQGRYVIAWRDSGRGFFARRFDAAGNALGGELELTGNLPTLSGGDISANVPGQFIASWLRPDSTDRIVEARRYDAAGLPLGDAFEVSSFSPKGPFDGIGVELLDDQSFVVAWSDGEEISARLYDVQGDPAGAEFQVSQLNYPYSFFSTRPRVEAEANGRFRLVWATDINLEEVTTMTRTVTGTGVLGTLTDLDLPSVDFGAFSMTGNGEFVVSRVPYFPRLLHGTRFDAGHGVLSEFEIVEEADYDICCSAIAHQSADSRDFIVAWQEPPPGESEPDVRARRFGSLLFADGFESGRHLGLVQHGAVGRSWVLSTGAGALSSIGTRRRLGC